MPTVIGIDPHPQHHTAAALTAQGSVQDIQTFPNSAAGRDAFLAWLARFGSVRLAVEGPTQTFFTEWLTHLWAAGMPVVGIPAQHVRQRRGRRKTDPEDAVLVARILVAEPERPAMRPPEWLRPLQEMTRTRTNLAHQLQATRMRHRATHLPAVQAALGQVSAALAAAVAALDQEIAEQVRILAPRLLKVPGVGPVLAGVLLAESGDIRRFATPHQYATYCGAAPVPWESGGSKRVRVNRGGNRRLNWAVHMIARTRLRIDPATRALVARKKGEGKTHREALRVLKTYLARQLYTVLSEVQPLPLPSPS